MRLSIVGKFTGALLVGLALLLLVGVAATVSTWRLVAANRRIAHAYDVRSELALILAGLSRAEAGARAVFASGDTAALPDYRAGVAQWQAGFDRAWRLAAGDPVLRRRLAGVDSMWSARRANLDELVMLAGGAPLSRDVLAQRTRLARAATARIMAAVAEADQDERARLAGAVAAAGRTATLTAVASAAVVLIAATLALLARRAMRRDMARQSEADRALRESEARLQAVFDQTFQFAALLSLDGMTLEVNQTAMSLLGHVDSFVGRPFWQLDWESEAMRDRLHRALTDAAGGSLVRLEVELRRGDESSALLDLSLKPLYAGGGGPSMIIAEARDVTEQRAVEAALRTSEARYAGILDIAADAIITVDQAQRITFFNQGAERIFGYPAEEMVGESVDVLLPARFRSEHGGHVAAFAESGQGARRMGARDEIVGLRRNGEEFPAEASISSLESGGGRVLTVVLRDVTERVRVRREEHFLSAASELLASSLDYAATLEHVAQLAVPILGDACILDLHDASGEGELTVAHADAELRELVREMRRRFPPAPDGPHPLAVAQRTGRPILLPTIGEKLLAQTASDPEHRRIVERLGMRSALFVPLVVRGQVMGVLSSYASSRALDERDLALALELARRAAVAVDNARSYRTVQQSAQLREEVLGIVSHDLRNPISTIAMCAEALAGAPEPAETIELAGTIRGSTSWMLRVIKDLLDVSAIDAGKLSVDLQPTTAASVVEALAAMFAPLATERGIVLDVGAPPDRVRFEADPDRLVQAIGNLIGNGIKFTPRGGRVGLAAERRGDAIAFRVSDSGRGIPPEHLPHLFDRFWQARATRRGGAGLGLAIAKGIAEAHGGHIEVDSVVGTGSTFTLVLPVTSDPGVVPPPGPGPQPVEARRPSGARDG